MIASIDTSRSLATGSDYSQALFDSLVRLGDHETERGKYFERVFVYYAGIAPDFGGDVKDILRSEEWSVNPNSGWDGPKIDVGIDFVLTMKSPSDKPIAVQTKFTTRTLGKDAIDGLGVQTITPDRLGMFARQIVVSNVDRENLSSVLVGEAARTGINVLGREWFDEINDGLLAQGKIPPVTLEEVEALIPNPVQPALVPLTPRPHQERINSHVMQTLLKSDRTSIHAACGTGKTLSAWALFDSLVPVNKVGIVYTPALSLVDGVIHAFKRQQTPDDRYDIRAVCSDKSVGRKRDSDGNDMSPSEVRAQVMSDSEDIRAWLQSPPDGRRRLLVSTYQSSERVIQAIAGTDIQFALQINDEAHRLAGAGAFGKHVWDVPAAKIVSLTATPRVTRLKASAGENVTVTSMSDETLFGAMADWAVYPISQGVEDKVLAPYIIEILVTPHADDINSETRVDDSDHDARMAAITKITTDIRDENDGKGSSIVYYNSRARSRKYAAFHKGIDNNFPVEHIDGETHVSQRLKAISHIEMNGGVLTNVSVLNEGVDIPSLNAVVFADVRSSKVDIIQAIGRTTRRDPHNPDKVGRVIIPVAVKDGVDSEEMVADSDFSQVWEVLKAVSDHDDTIMRDMIEVRHQLGRGERPRIPSSLRDKMRIVAPDGVTVANPQWESPEFLDEFMSSVTTHAVRSIVPNWYETYEQVFQYTVEHGKCPSTISQDTEIRRLGAWCANQRQRHKKGKLSPERVPQLEAIPGWYWVIRSPAPWDSTLIAVRKYIVEHGKFPSKDSKDAETRHLGRWCDAQRQRHKKGKLSPERVPQLEAIPGWFWDNHGAWDSTLIAVRKYIAEHGKFPSKDSKDAETRHLGAWCNAQRQNHKKGKLSPERVPQLEAIPGWSWVIRSTAAWDNTLIAVREYIAEHGKCPSTISQDTEIRRLGAWCTNQRQNHKKGKLSPERVPQLEAIPGWFWSSSRAG